MQGIKLYSEDLRARIGKAVEEGTSKSRAARLFHVVTDRRAQRRTCATTRMFLRHHNVYLPYGYYTRVSKVS
jgi:hypothetical protein